MTLESNAASPISFRSVALTPPRTSCAGSCARTLADEAVPGLPACLPVGRRLPALAAAGRAQGEARLHQACLARCEGWGQGHLTAEAHHTWKAVSQVTPVWSAIWKDMM